MQEFCCHLRIKNKLLIIVLFTAVVHYILFPQFTYSKELQKNGPDNYFADTGIVNIGVELIACGHYQKAEVFWKEYTIKYPENIEGFFFQAVTLQSEILETENDKREKELEELLNICSERLDAALKINKQDVFLIFMKANTEGLISTYKASSGSWLSAIKHGKKSKNLFKEVIEKNAQWNEAYAGMGSYEYWKSAATKPVWWLPFLGDNRDKGISYLEKALKPGSFSYYFTLNQLAWVYYDKKEYNKVIEICKNALKKYTNSRAFLDPLAESYRKLNNHELAMESFLKIQNSLVKDGYGNTVIFLKYSVKAAESAQESGNISIIKQIYSEMENRRDPEGDNKKAAKLKKLISNIYFSDNN